MIISQEIAQPNSSYVIILTHCYLEKVSRDIVPGQLPWGVGRQINSLVVSHLLIVINHLDWLIETVHFHAETDSILKADPMKQNVSFYHHRFRD